MKTYYCTDIEWDTDGLPADLPTETMVRIDESSEYVADALSDEYGFCIFALCITLLCDRCEQETRNSDLDNNGLCPDCCPDPARDDPEFDEE
ncbi:hypothetical protein HN588_07055 [Candidatus Bathyarchaeota archaeon]|jgi:hypothetical protein|nr:hypothetical protein [Candidatus Bathyarchaeota archaeon]